MGEVKQQDPAIDYALGTGLMLLGSVLAGSLMAFLLSGMVGKTYVTFLMPLLAGWAIGAVVGLIARGFRVRDTGPVVATALLGAMVAYGAFHLITYTDIISQLATAIPPDVAAETPNVSAEQLVHQQFEIATAKEGFWAYLAYTSTEAGSALSPLGLLAKGGIAYSTALIVLIAEAFICLGSAVAMALFRARRRPKRKRAATPERVEAA